MTELPDDGVTTDGLRERKKRRTRASLIEAAAQLCFRDGYDNTTVDQIAAAADVAPRTFSRYFPNKESVVVAMNDDMDEAFARALEQQPTDITEYEAMLGAFISLLRPTDGEDSAAFARVAVRIQIVNASTSFRESSLWLHRDRTRSARREVMAARMGVPVEDPALALITNLCTVLFSTATAGLGLPGHPPIEADVVCERLTATLESFRRTWGPWRASP